MEKTTPSSSPVGKCAAERSPRSLAERFLQSDNARLALMTAAIFVVMAMLSPGRFLSLGNVISMAFQFPEFAILSLAMMMAMLTGGIDLSIIGIANLSAICAAFILSFLAGPSAEGMPAIVAFMLAVLASLSIGAIAGVLNGVAISFFGLPAILATLGSGLVFKGLGFAMTGGSAVLGFPAVFAGLGNGNVLGIPVPLVIFAGLAIFVWFVLERTALGLRIQMFGTNPLATRFAGVNDVSVTIRTFMISGMLAAISGLIIMSRANSAKADYGSSYLLLSILICVLGGINPYGGFGRVSGLLLAVLSLQFLSSGLNMLQVSNFATEFIWGGLLLAVMTANTIRIRRRPERPAGLTARN